MIKLLSRFFIKNRNDTNDPRVRSAYGMLCGIVGIFLNILLLAGKLVAGIASGATVIALDTTNSREAISALTDNIISSFENFGVENMTQYK